LDKAFSLVWTLIVIEAIVRVGNVFLQWYLHKAVQAQPQREQELRTHLGLVRKVTLVIVIVVGALYFLRSVGVDISPLVAGGAVTGLVIGLALQDTLSNLFAGFFLNVDRPIKVGDWVQLETGEEGIVTEIGWRHTKIRSLLNYYIIIPNNKLSQSVIVNRTLPEPELLVIVPCGVSYDSDLDFVEEVTKEVAQQVQRQVEGADPNWQPIVRWQSFGDSSISFAVVLKVLHPTAQYVLRSEFIKALHRRYKEENIEIPFPIRTVILRSPDDPKVDYSS